MSKLTPKTKQHLRARRHRRVRAKVSGTAECPRLAVFRSNRRLYAQLIDDTNGTTIASASFITANVQGLKQQAEAVGEAIANAAKAKGVTRVVFDRGGFTYTGVIRTLADTARARGLVF